MFTTAFAVVNFDSQKLKWECLLWETEGDCKRFLYSMNNNNLQGFISICSPMTAQQQCKACSPGSNK